MVVIQLIIDEERGITRFTASQLNNVPITEWEEKLGHEVINITEQKCIEHFGCKPILGSTIVRDGKRS